MSNILILLLSSLAGAGLNLNSPNKSVLIVGDGALGLGLGANLQRQGWRVGMVGRTGLKAARFSLIEGGATEFFDFPVVGQAEAKEFSLVLLAVRANDFAAASNWVGTFFSSEGTQDTSGLSKEVVVVALGNGMRGLEVANMQTRFPDLRWRIGMSTLGVSEISPNVFEKRNPCPKTAWGALALDLAIALPVETAALKALDGGEWQKDSLAAVGEKWLFSTCLNSLCGVYQLPRNGLALVYVKALGQLFDEAFFLGERQMGPWRRPQEVLWQSLLALIEATKFNENSMARDVRLRRVTETEYLAGLAVGEYDFPLLKIFHGVLVAGSS